MADDERYTVGAGGERRLRNTHFVLPIRFGTVAFFLGKKASETKSHQWTVFVAGADHQNITHVVKKVTFQLHPSFENPVRVVEQPPFELTETGWGEFDIGIVLHFVDEAKENDVELLHRLKLYSETDATPNPKKPVVSEQHDELVFWEPTEEFYMAARQVQPSLAPPMPNNMEAHLARFVEQEEVNRLLAARNKVSKQRSGVVT